MNVKISSLTLVFVLAGLQQGFAQQITADEIMNRVVSRNEKIQDYTVMLTANVDVERLRVPKMEAKMYFKRPDKVHFESKGFAMLPREGVAFDPVQLRDKYAAELKGEEQIENVRTYRLQLTAKQSKTRPNALTLWVDLTHWTVRKLETLPYEGRSVVVVFEHALVQETYYLPSKIVVTFDVPEMPSPEAGSQPGVSETPRRSSQRKGSVTVMYKDYQVNVGLSDDLFKESASKAQ